MMEHAERKSVEALLNFTKQRQRPLVIPILQPCDTVRLGQDPDPCETRFVKVINSSAQIWATRRPTDAINIKYKPDCKLDSLK